NGTVERHTAIYDNCESHLLVLQYQICSGKENVLGTVEVGSKGIINLDIALGREGISIRIVNTVGFS
ncbi:hypothetical protein Q6280_27225, partial [Klebsiella pneumoniae]|uniref:hypothetical protein n=1 Tax=Klebsiella pneumoniae TaxID=573 RepID=UPI00272F934E